MEKIRVLQFEICSKTGGIESFLLNLDQYIKNQVVCDVICPFEECLDQDKFESFGGKVFNISSPRHLLKYIHQINLIMRQGRYDLVHMNRCSAINIIPIVLAFYNKLPIIVHSHNSMTRIGKLGIPLHLINRNIVNLLSDDNIACSKVAGDWMFGKNDYHIVKNGVDVQRYRFDAKKRARLRRELNIEEKKKVFTNLGDLRIQKNPLKLIEIFAELVKTSDALLLVIGDGVMRVEVEERVRNLELDDKVLFMGHREDIADIINGVDAILMPSLYEGLPMSCIEAQANGAQLFLADTISHESDITGKVTWFSLEESAQEIAKKIEANYRDLTEAERIRDNSVVLLNGFDVSGMAEEILKEYKKINKR